MKKFFTILLGIACITVVFLGHSHWNKKIEASSGSTSASASEKSNKESARKENTKSLQEDLLSYTTNWPLTAIETFKKAINEGRPFKILFVGSPDIGSDRTGSYPTVKEKLIKTFGKENIQVELRTFNSTSTKFISENNQAGIAAEKADLIIFEPFILVNNGELLPENTLNDATEIMDTIKEKNPETTFILQPSYPLYHAKIYPKQVEMLKTFAKENQITYLDHWSAWPDPNTDAFKAYLQPDQSAPSKKGYKVWSNYLIKYLTNQ